MGVIMKKSLRLIITLSIIALFSTALVSLFYKTKLSPGETQMMAQFAKAIRKFKATCIKNPKSKIKTLLKDIDNVQTNINANCVISISKQLEKDPEIKKISAKIHQKVNKKPDIIKKCFKQKDLESFPAFEKHLRKSTIKCGGLSLLGSKTRETYEAAAFVTAANYLKTYR